MENYYEVACGPALAKWIDEEIPSSPIAPVIEQVTVFVTYKNQEIRRFQSECWMSERTYLRLLEEYPIIKSEQMYLAMTEE